MREVLRSLTLEYFGAGRHKITAGEFLDRGEGLFLDVRTTEEAESLAFPLGGHEGILSLHVPLHELPDRVGEIPRDRPIGIFCPASTRSAMAWLYLRTEGFEDVRIIEGGYPDLTTALKPGRILARLRGRADP